MHQNEGKLTIIHDYTSYVLSCVVVLSCITAIVFVLQCALYWFFFLKFLNLLSLHLYYYFIYTYLPTHFSTTFSPRNKRFS